MAKNPTIAFLGAGSMAEAMIAGIVATEQTSPNHIIVTNRSNTERLVELHNKYGIQGIKQEHLSFDKIDVLILAMKPKHAQTVLQSLKHHIRPNQLILSVLAGISTAYIENYLHEGQQVIRVMPNTSAMIQESATAISAGIYTTANNVAYAQTLLQCLGEVYIIDENHMDIFTGIAGSGPAYFYYLMEHIEAVGKEAGLDSEVVRNIGAQTILGAAKMILQQNDTPAELREKVTSPNGTTAAGLAALKKHGGGRAIAQAVKGAAKRSQEISAQLRKETKTV
jgi:pyrroline-5-carboxylate reductase